jgi:hypothetical protein
LLYLLGISLFKALLVTTGGVVSLLVGLVRVTSFAGVSDPVNTFRVALVAETVRCTFLSPKGCPRAVATVEVALVGPVRVDGAFF